MVLYKNIVVLCRRMDLAKQNWQTKWFCILIHHRHGFMSGVLGTANCLAIRSDPLVHRVNRNSRQQMFKGFCSNFGSSMLQKYTIYDSFTQCRSRLQHATFTTRFPFSHPDGPFSEEEVASSLYAGRLVPKDGRTADVGLATNVEGLKKCPTTWRGEVDKQKSLSLELALKPWTHAVQRNFNQWWFTQPGTGISWKKPMPQAQRLNTSSRQRTMMQSCFQRFFRHDSWDV